jgi:Family of unknown function (DUF6489)
MKITIDIDATPAEVREFFGLPDLRPLQEEIVQTLRDTMQKGMQGFDPTSLLATVWPAQLQTMEAMQKAFWSQFGKTVGAASGEESGKDRK